MSLLVTMRLIDMTKTHPAQDNSRVCSRCFSRVGLYPSGQAALRRDPSLQVVCVPCVAPETVAGAIHEPAARTLDELLAEMRDSKEVKSA